MDYLQDQIVALTAPIMYKITIPIVTRVAILKFFEGKIRRYKTHMLNFVKQDAILYRSWAAKNHYGVLVGAGGIRSGEWEVEDGRRGEECNSNEP